MPPRLIDIMTPWHDLYMLFGTASATLIGLLFVAASVGSRFYNADRHPAMRSFLSPSVVHFTCVLAASLIAVSPIRSWGLIGLLIGSNGLFGIIYTLAVVHRMVRHGLAASIDLEDRIWYAAMPVVAYVIMTAAGVTLFCRTEAGCEVQAVAMGLLLLTGIRNAWDITVWTVVQGPD